MSLALLIVTYDLAIPVEDFRGAARKAAVQIAGAPGLIWKIWGLEANGEGTSAYLFRSEATARAFATGPAIAALRDGPARDVTTRIAPVATDLSRVTHAATALSLMHGADLG
ncbi:MAG: YdhR family protein [Pseudooceanicola sp.]